MIKRELAIVFMGTPDFAVASLKALVENNYNVVGVITAPDRPAGRGQKLKQSPVKEYAVEKGLYLMQPEKLKDAEFLEELKSLKANLQVVVAFRMLPELVWNMPEFGTFNLHASLLPRYRGAAPINWAIINGEKVTGVTSFFIEHEIDTGKIIYNRQVPIGDDETAGSLHDKLMETGSGLVVETVAAIARGEYPQVPQSELVEAEEILKPAPKIFKDDCRIDWNKPINEVFNLIRGLSPYPAAWTELKDQEDRILSLKVYETEKIVGQHGLVAGTIISDSKSFLKIAVNGGYISINNMQMAGKKRMATDEFLRGFQQISKCVVF